MIARKNNLCIPRRTTHNKTLWEIPIYIAVAWVLQSVICASPESPTYATEIAPIIDRHCIQCHHPKGLGPFSLVGFEDVKKRARQISEVVEDRFMPPWKPAEGYGPPLANERRLSQSEITLIRRWFEQGTPPGDLSLAPRPKLKEDHWQLDEPDLVVEMETPFLLGADGEDVFRNFVIPIPLDESQYVRALEFQPNVKLAIHHAIVAIDPTPRSRTLDAQDPQPGYESMDLGSAVTPFGHLIGWAPGQVPYEAFPGTNWKLEPSTDLVVQLHLLPTGKIEEISPRIGIFFTDDPPTRLSMVVQLRETEIDIAPDQTDYEIEETFTIPISTKLLSLFPHTHFLGKDIRVFAELPNGETQWLIRIPDWDFNWQSSYRFQEPLPLPAGSKLVMKYSFDNSLENPRNPSNPPRRVRLGSRSYDEMAEVAIQLLLDENDDWPILLEAQSRYDLAATATEPRPSSLYDLARALKAQGKRDEAIEQFETLRSRSQVSQQILFELIDLYVDIGDIGKAIETIEEGKNMFGTDSRYRYRQAELYQKADLLLTAARHYRTAADLAVAEQNAEPPQRATNALYNAAILYGQRGNWKEVENSLNTLLQIDPANQKGLLMSASVALQSNEAARGRGFLDRILALPIEKRIENQVLLDMLPFPVGPLNAIRAYADHGDEHNASELLKLTIEEAEKRSMNDLVERLIKLNPQK